MPHEHAGSCTAGSNTRQLVKLREPQRSLCNRPLKQICGVQRSTVPLSSTAAPALAAAAAGQRCCGCSVATSSSLAETVGWPNPGPSCMALSAAAAVGMCDFDGLRCALHTQHGTELETRRAVRKSWASRYVTHEFACVPSCSTVNTGRASLSKLRRDTWLYGSCCAVQWGLGQV